MSKFMIPSQNSHILIVDDNPENIHVLGSSLRQQNYELAIAQSGSQALKAVEEFKPDLILLDVMMPEVDGFKVCEILKNNPCTQDIEIIFLTAAVAHHDELKGLSLGAVDYIHKPFSIPIVQAKVALHLERVHHKRLRDDVERITRHDLKNPLNALLGYPQLMLLDDNLTTEQREYLEEMLSAGNEMLNMINNSLDLFKIETGRYRYAPQPLDIGLLIRTIIKDLRLLIKAYKIKINFPSENQIDSADQSLIVLAEKSLSYTLFANLIRNAIEACPTDGTITIAMKCENNNGIITITNPGTVPEAIRSTFFEKYATAGKKQGTGLGTYSARLMATVQNGDITMTTNHEETCLTVKLPIA